MSSNFTNFTNDITHCLEATFFDYFEWNKINKYFPFNAIFSNSDKVVKKCSNFINITSDITHCSEIIVFHYFEWNKINKYFPLLFQSQ